MSEIEELKRRRDVFAKILEGMAADHPDRDGYVKDLNKIVNELKGLESEPLPEKVEEKAPGSEAQAEVPADSEEKFEEEGLGLEEAQTEALDLPAKEESRVVEDKTEGKEKSNPKEKNPLAGVSTKLLIKELARRLAEHLKNE